MIKWIKRKLGLIPKKVELNGWLYVFAYNYGRIECTEDRSNDWVIQDIIKELAKGKTVICWLNSEPIIIKQNKKTGKIKVRKIKNYKYKF